MQKRYKIFITESSLNASGRVVSHKNLSGSHMFSGEIKKEEKDGH